MSVSNAFKTSYFSLAAQFINYVEDYCENLDAKLKQHGITTCDKVKTALLKAVIKRVAAIALIFIASLDLLIDIGASFIGNGRRARNIIGSLATIFKSTLGILTGQLPGIAYDLYKEGMAHSVGELVVQPMVKEFWIMDRTDDYSNDQVDKFFNGRIKVLERILKNSKIVTDTNLIKVLLESIDPLLNNGSTMLPLPKREQVMEAIIKHTRGTEAFDRLIVQIRQDWLGKCNWEGIEDTLLNDLNIHEISGLLEIHPLTNYRGFSRQQDIVTNIYKNYFKKVRELQGDSCLMTIADFMHHLSRSRCSIRNKIVTQNAVIQLIKLLGVQSPELVTIGKRSDLSDCVIQELLRKFLSVPSTSLTPQQIKLVLHLSLRVQSVIPDLQPKLDEFYQTHKSDVIDHLNEYAEEYLATGSGVVVTDTDRARDWYDRVKEGYGLDRKRVAQLINSIIQKGKGSLSEKEIDRLFKVAIVTFDYELVEKLITENDHLLLNEFISATLQGLDKIMEINIVKQQIKMNEMTGDEHLSDWNIFLDLIDSLYIVGFNKSTEEFIRSISKRRTELGRYMSSAYLESYDRIIEAGGKVQKEGGILPVFQKKLFRLITDRDAVRAKSSDRIPDTILDIFSEYNPPAGAMDGIHEEETETKEKYDKESESLDEREG